MVRMPTASIAVSTPRPPVSRMIASAALPSLLLTAAHSCCSAEARRYRETIVVDIDHYDVKRRKELCRKESRESDRSAPTIATVAPGCIFAVEHATLKSLSAGCRST